MKHASVRGVALAWSSMALRRNASPATLISLGLGVVGLAAFVVIEPRRRNPLMRFVLFRHLNFSAAVISQLLAGSIELATAYLLPFYLLLVIGLAPGPAGLALIPATVPIIIMAPWPDDGSTG